MKRRANPAVDVGGEGTSKQYAFEYQQRKPQTLSFRKISQQSDPRCHQCIMGTGAISFCVAWLLVSPAVFSLTVVKVKFGDSVTLPCNGSAFRGSSGGQLDVLWRMPESVDVRKVARYAHGEHSVGVHFSNRATFRMERITDGDFSLTINPAMFSDEGFYECMWHPGQNDQVFLMDVRLYVLRPPVPVSISVHVNDLVTLPCYSHLNKWAPEELSVQWKRVSGLVLKLSSGQLHLIKSDKPKVKIKIARLKVRLWYGNCKTFWSVPTVLILVNLDRD
ncbi:hypothetical protein GJAV_G00025220 [Gymnothorax javanicus]|nr:hypothetical protein GJAV_G00025220 [Gymnothorax javanicus]